MPCSRSAGSPSVSSARLVYSSPRALLVCSTDASWSSKIALESYSSRPMSVLLPSSTDPAVANRRMSIISSSRRTGLSQARGRTSEVPLPLAVFHGRLARAVVRAGLAALGDPGRCDLGDHFGNGRGRRLDGSRVGHVADRSVPDGRLEQRLVLTPRHERAVREQDPVALEDAAGMR